MSPIELNPDGSFKPEDRGNLRDCKENQYLPTVESKGQFHAHIVLEELGHQESEFAFGVPPRLETEVLSVIANQVNSQGSVMLQVSGLLKSQPGVICIKGFQNPDYSGEEFAEFDLLD